MNKKLSRCIKYINIILAIFIVILHSKNYVYYENNSELINITVKIEEFFTKYIFSCAVPFLFFISGYLFYQNIEEKSIYKKIKSRVTTLLIPYILWNIISTVYFVSMLYIPFIKNKISIEHIGGIKGLLQSIFLFKYNQINWFVFQLIIYVAISPIIYKIIKNKFLSVVLGGVLFCVSLIGIDTRFISVCSFKPVFRIDCLLYYFLGAIAGYYFKNIIMESANKTNKKSIIIAVLLILLSFLIVSINAHHFEIIAYILQIVALYILIKDIGELEIIEKISRHIDPFFLLQTHYFIMYPLKKIVAGMFYKISCSALISYFMCPFITILIIYIMGRWLKDKEFKWYRILIGGR